MDNRDHESSGEKERKRGEKSSTQDAIDRIESDVYRKIIQTIRGLAILVRDFGMPVIAFSAGIYLLLVVGTATPEYAAIIAGSLVAVGLLSQIWFYAREHPRRANEDVTRQLDRMTDMVERFFDSR